MGAQLVFCVFTVYIIAIAYTKEIGPRTPRPNENCPKFYVPAVPVSKLLSSPSASMRLPFRRGSTFHSLSLIVQLIPRTSAFDIRLPGSLGEPGIRTMRQPVSCTPHSSQLSSSIFPIIFLHFPIGSRSVLRYVYHVAARPPHFGILPNPHPACCRSSLLLAETLCLTPPSVTSVPPLDFPAPVLSPSIFRAVSPSAAFFASSSASFPNADVALHLA